MNVLEMDQTIEQALLAICREHDCLPYYLDMICIQGFLVSITPVHKDRVYECLRPQGQDRKSITLGVKPTVTNYKDGEECSIIATMKDPLNLLLEDCTIQDDGELTFETKIYLWSDGTLRCHREFLKKQGIK